VPSRVTIRRDRVLLADGQPFFPLQARHVPEGATLADLAAAGFNCTRWLVGGGLNMTALPVPDDLHGLKLCAYLYDRFNFP